MTEINISLEEFLHVHRQGISKLVQSLKGYLDSKPDKAGREVALAHTKLEEAKMWLGKALGEAGAKLPADYPADN